MIACAFVAAPKFSPPAGTPPITPGSAVSVIRSVMRFLGRDRGHALGHADAEVDDALGLISSAARRAMILRSLIAIGAQQVHRHADLAGEGGAVRLGEGLPVVLGLLGDDHAVDQHAGDLHLPRRQRAALGDALDLHDDDAAGVVRRHRHRQRFERQRLALHRDVAVGVGAWCRGRSATSIGNAL